MFCKNCSGVYNAQVSPPAPSIFSALAAGFRACSRISQPSIWSWPSPWECVSSQYDTAKPQVKILFLWHKEVKVSIFFVLAHFAQVGQLLGCFAVWQGRLSNPTLHGGTSSLSLWVLCILWEWPIKNQVRNYPCPLPTLIPDLWKIAEGSSNKQAEGTEERKEIL